MILQVFCCNFCSLAWTVAAVKAFAIAVVVTMKANLPLWLPSFREN